MKIRALNSYILEMYRHGLIVAYRSPKKERLGKVDCITCGRAKIARDYGDDNSFHNYIEDLRMGNYGIMLCDGGLVQLSYKLEKQHIISHRYCYIPSPVITRDTIEPENYSEQVVEAVTSREDILLRSKVRFDFEKEGEFENHPESHLTMISPECRIALRGGLDIKRFFRFVFLNFIDSSLVKKHEAIFRSDHYDLGTLSDQWTRELHVNWHS